jgi:hypothetical protein
MGGNHDNRKGSEIGAQVGDVLGLHGDQLKITGFGVSPFVLRSARLLFLLCSNCWSTKSLRLLCSSFFPPFM